MKLVHRLSPARLISGFKRAVRNGPMEFMAMAFLGLTMSISVENEISGDLTATICTAAFLVVVASLAFNVLQRFGVFSQATRWVLTVAYAAGVSAYTGFFFDPDVMSHLWRWGIVAIAATVGLVVAPLAASGAFGAIPANERLRRFNTRLVFRSVLATAYTASLWIGLAIAMAMANELFDLRIDEENFFHLFTFLGFVVAPLIVLADLDDIARLDLVETPTFVRWRVITGKFLIAPLAAVYNSIAIAYFLRVVFTGEMPSNMLSPLYLGAVLLGFAGLLAFNGVDTKLSVWFHRLIPPSLLLTWPIAVIAITERIGQYGWTEFRFIRLGLVMCVGFAMAVHCYQLLRRHELSLAVLPLSIGCVFLLSSVGPFSVGEIAKQSQRGRLLDILSQTDRLDADGKFRVIEDSITWEDREVLESTVSYLVKHHGTESIDDIVPGALHEHSKDSWRIVEAMLGNTTIVQDREMVYLRNGDQTYQLTALGTMKRVRRHESRYRIHTEGTEVKIIPHGSSRSYTINFSALVERAASDANLESVPRELNSYTVSCRDDQGNEFDDCGQYLLETLDLRRGAAEAADYSIENFNGMLIMRDEPLGRTHEGW